MGSVLTKESYKINLQEWKDTVSHPVSKVAVLLILAYKYKFIDRKISNSKVKLCFCEQLCEYKSLFYFNNLYFLLLESCVSVI